MRCVTLQLQLSPPHLAPAVCLCSKPLSTSGSGPLLCSHQVSDKIAVGALVLLIPISQDVLASNICNLVEATMPAFGEEAQSASAQPTSTMQAHAICIQTANTPNVQFEHITGTILGLSRCLGDVSPVMCNATNLLVQGRPAGMTSKGRNCRRPATESLGRLRSLRYNT